MSAPVATLLDDPLLQHALGALRYEAPTYWQRLAQGGGGAVSRPLGVAGSEPMRRPVQSRVLPLSAGEQFYQLAAYTPGDALNQLHWPTSARMGTPYKRTTLPTPAHRLSIIVWLDEPMVAGGNADALPIARAYEALLRWHRALPAPPDRWQLVTLNAATLGHYWAPVQAQQPPSLAYDRWRRQVLQWLAALCHLSPNWEGLPGFDRAYGRDALLGLARHSQVLLVASPRSAAAVEAALGPWLAGLAARQQLVCLWARPSGGVLEHPRSHPEDGWWWPVRDEALLPVAARWVWPTPLQAEDELPIASAFWQKVPGWVC